MYIFVIIISFLVFAYAIYQIQSSHNKTKSDEEKKRKREAEKREIDNKDGIIVREEAKTVESRRRIALPPYLVTLYRQRSGDWILPTGGNALYRHYKFVTKKAGYDLCFHDLRHICASEMKALNIPDKYAMERGGWSTDNILKSVYQSTFSDERQRYEDIINDHFQKIYDVKCDSKSKKLAQIRYFKRLK